MFLLKVQGMHTLDVFFKSTNILRKKAYFLIARSFYRYTKVPNVKDILKSKLLISLFLILKLC
jgi:hypothetical protein